MGNLLQPCSQEQWPPFLSLLATTCCPPLHGCGLKHHPILHIGILTSLFSPRSLQMITATELVCTAATSSLDLSISQAILLVNSDTVSKHSFTMFPEPRVGEVDIGGVSTTECVWAFMLDPLTKSPHEPFTHWEKRHFWSKSRVAYVLCVQTEVVRRRIEGTTKNNSRSPHPTVSGTKPFLWKRTLMLSDVVDYPQSWYASIVHQGVHQLADRYWSTQALHQLRPLVSGIV